MLSKLLAVLFVLNVIFLLATLFVHDIYMEKVQTVAFFQDVTVSLIIDEFNLGNENNLAAWYSSMLLMTVSLVVLACYRIDIAHGRGIFKNGWLIISALFVFLSFDELGSLHENAGKLSQLDIIGDRSWESVLIIPGTLILVFMSVFAWISLRHQLVVMVLMCAGTALFVSVPFQEHFEIALYNKNVSDSSWRRPGIHVLAEEGSELFGALCFLAAFITYIKSRLTAAGVVDIIFKKRVIITWLVVILVAGSILCFLIYKFNYLIISSDGGTAWNWPPAAIAFTTFMFCSLDRHLKWYQAIFFLIVSAYFGSNFYALIYWEDITRLILGVETVLLATLIMYVLNLRKQLALNKWKILHYCSLAVLYLTFVSPENAVTVAAFCLVVLTLLTRIISVNDIALSYEP